MGETPDTRSVKKVLGRGVVDRLSRERRGFGSSVRGSEALLRNIEGVETGYPSWEYGLPRKTHGKWVRSHSRTIRPYAEGSGDLGSVVDRASNRLSLLSSSVKRARSRDVTHTPHPVGFDPSLQRTTVPQLKTDNIDFVFLLSKQMITLNGFFSKKPTV